MKVYYLFFLLLAACGNSNSGTTSPVTRNPGESTDKHPPTETPALEPRGPTTPSDSQPIQSGVRTVDPKTKSMTHRPVVTNVTPSDSAEIQLRKN